MMRAFPSTLFAILMALAVVSSSATTVIPPTFNELVDEADLIFQGSVTGVKSEWVGEGAQRQIMTYVTLKVEQALKGAPGQSYSIRMLGGTVDGETMAVADAPKFEVGDEDILFVRNNGTQFIPLVGIMHGRFHVRKEATGRDVVTTNDGDVVKNVAQLGARNATAAANQAGLTPSEFKAAISARLQQTGHSIP